MKLRNTISNRLLRARLIEIPADTSRDQRERFQNCEL
jgi:hypothetical protein